MLKPVTVSSPIQLTARPEVNEIRPYVVAAVLRNVNFTQDAFDSFIDLQEKLHQNICRKRTLVAIGAHDLDTVIPPFTYTARPPEEIKFMPLNQTREFSAPDLMKFYATDSHLRPYLPIIEYSLNYPVIYDRLGTILSMPPIINGDHSKISLQTRNIFIECTATDLHKATIVLDTIVAMYHEFYEYIEQVSVTQADGSHCMYPELKYWDLVTSVKYINSQVGISLTSDKIVNLLQRMGLQSTATDDVLTVSVPPTRHDILHACDIVEDVAISYGYNNIPMRIPMIATNAHQLPINKFTDLVRVEIASIGFTEVLTFSLCSREDISTKLNDPLGADVAVHISNPKTSDFEVARTKLLPGILKTICNSRSWPLPLKMFEIQDVVLKDPTSGDHVVLSQTGAKNRRHFCAVYCGKRSGFEVIHGLLDRFMRLVGWSFGTEKNCYHLENSSGR
ncbi:unnamed protein product [Soboliphyme baturini]|uniref:phenylalanine--tRNA ligase n=1 Tax=Soboliphyme baturini TaxID=241478 RepID=A0A183IDQ2_9BILA|nr:unnamed protein product [Soboliphyme baturini]